MFVVVHLECAADVFVGSYSLNRHPTQHVIHSQDRNEQKDNASHKKNSGIGLDVNNCWAHAFTHTHTFRGKAKVTGSTFTDLTPKQTVSTRSSTHSKLLNVAVLS